MSAAGREMVRFRARMEIENGATVFPQEVRDLLWTNSWDHGHSNGYTEIDYYYSDFAALAMAAFNAGRSSN